MVQFTAMAGQAAHAIVIKEKSGSLDYRALLGHRYPCDDFSIAGQHDVVLNFDSESTSLLVNSPKPLFYPCQ